MGERFPTAARVEGVAEEYVRRELGFRRLADGRWRSGPEGIVPDLWAAVEAGNDETAVDLLEARDAAARGASSGPESCREDRR